MNNLRGERLAARLALGVGLGAAVLLGGCASKPAVIQGYQDQPSTVGPQIVDERPQKDKESEMLSFWVSSCDYGISRLGDEVTQPSRLAIIQQDIESSFGSKVQDSIITVSRYRIFYSQGAALSHMAAASSGLLGLLLADAIAGVSHCVDGDPSGGRYLDREVTTSYSPLIVEIGITLDKKDYSIRSVYSPAEEFGGGSWSDPAAASALFAAIHKANAALIQKIKQSLG